MNDKFDSDAFRNVCGLWASGVSIVTTIDKSGRPFGLTMNAVSSLSLAPPMMLVCVDDGSDTLVPILESNLFCINVLSAPQQSISNTFAKKGSDKFENVDWKVGEYGTPLIQGSVVSIECAVKHVYEGGDHKIVCGLVKKWNIDDKNTEPLLYFGGSYQKFQS